ncbi:uncharacterized protein LOC123544964 [Mercenaria mercenaria]|uniref:uncharacterized protein LOC123544964 n=1 Tax=Mercenaria mercenaria TaxID=6596 RepID=UPI00234F0D6B|nr:uncharacterized protein LOC123544964 [Mercenaria mercenaria]
MDSHIYMCLITVVCVQLSSSDEAYFVNRKITGYLDKAVNKLEEENIDIRTNQGSKHLQQEKTAREAVEDEIKQLVNSFQDAADWDLEERNGYLNRKNKRGWWWCPWCQGSKYILYIAKLFNCKCSVGSTTTCKCPNGKVLTDDRK